MSEGPQITTKYGPMSDDNFKYWLVNTSVLSFD